MKIASLFAVAVLAVATGAASQTAAPSAPMTERTDRIGLEGRRGPSLFRPGFAVAEYTGSATSRGSSSRLPWQSRDMARAEFDLSTSAGTVQGDCGGGQSHRQILWITFDREPLAYECQYAGAAPEGARLSLALSRGSLLSRLQQPQRAGELVWGDIVLRAETKRIGGLPFGGGRVMGYVFSRDGVEIGGLDLNGFRPTFYLPPRGSPDRDAAAVLAISLFAFQDPANR
ncbi:hypothetical protein [Brevundimonas sp.]|uniref:hypothetical protein n=1 Tax=Brevundimonas sp. TaxID=1871086 RepID=UPI002D732F6C|nr:hypothetical protein [Brevundimonas sp.]HYD26801.1 hypothetical protein [Brevundimonas sp.]